MIAVIASWLPTLLALPLALPQSDAPAAGDSPTAGESLESLLRRSRSEHAALMDALRPTVVALVAKFESVDQPTGSRLEEIHHDLDQLGREAGMLLLEYLDPGKQPTREIRFRTEQIKKAVIRLRPAGIVGDLIERTRKGALEEQKYALELLGYVPERARAGTHLRQFYRSATPELRLVCIRSIARLGGAASSAVLEGALQDEDPVVRREVMTALAVVGNEGAAPAIFGALANLEQAAPMAREIVSFYRRVPTVVDDTVLDALLDLALHLQRDADACVAVLDALPRFDAARSTRKSREIRDRIESLITTGSPEVRDGALVCAILLGDRKAKRRLLDPHDARIHDEPSYYKFYELRGTVLLQIAEPSDAAKDFRKALELIDFDKAPRYHELWIRLARAYVQGRKFSRTRQALVDMQMSFDERQMLLKDPDFAEFVATPRYAKIFQ